LLGHGTQRIEEILEQAFPNYAHIRLDRDSTRRKGSMESMLQDIHEHKYQIIIGTQILSKGHDFPDVTLVGVLDIDYGIYSHDFRAMERSAQLLMQVAGRAGRRDIQGEVYVQTHNPEHPLMTTLIQKDYAHFAQQALISRKDFQLPPYVFHISLRARASHIEAVQNFLIEAKNLAGNIFPPDIKVQGPIIPVMEKKAGQYRAFLLLTRTQRGQYTQIINQWIEQLAQQKTANRVHWSIDVDPIEFI
jgi:primosomal protein N' (replication factor Y)